MDGNKWDEFTTVDHKIFSEPERFVNAYSSDSIKKLDGAIVRQSNVAVQQRLQRAADRQAMRAKADSSLEGVGLEADEQRLPVSSGYEEQEASVGRARDASARRASDDSSVRRALDDASEGPASDKVCRVGFRVNRVVPGNAVCVSTSVVPQCSADLSACRDSERVSRRHASVAHICVPKNSASLRSAATAIADASPNLDKATTLTEERLRYVVKIFERSPRSEYREYGVDMCWENCLFAQDHKINSDYD